MARASSRPGANVDLAAHLAALPKDATGKGVFFLDVIKRVQVTAPSVDVAELAGLPPRRYLMFGDYPYGDLLRLVVAAAGVMYPKEPLAEGVRLVGHSLYDALLEAHIGRVLFGVLGKNFQLVARMGPRGWKVSMSFGRVEVEELGPGHVRFHIDEMPAFLDTLMVGIVEGAMRACGVIGGRVEPRLESIAKGVLDVTWTPLRTVAQRLTASHSRSVPATWAAARRSWSTPPTTRAGRRMGSRAGRPCPFRTTRPG